MHSQVVDYDLVIDPTLPEALVLFTMVQFRERL
jgi:hypothetical protein